MPRYDVVVVGGGPAGSVCAARLAQRGLRVLVLEKERFPRFHLGESFLPQSLPLLERIGVLGAIEASFLLKYGARFHDDASGREDRFSFDGAWRAEQDHAFHAPRAELDQLLLRHAASLGAEVREAAEVTGVIRDGAGRVSGVEVAWEGVTSAVEARFVVDASGRHALFGRGAGGTTKISGLDQTALYAHFEGISRPEGKLAGDIDVVLFRPQGGRPSWFWFIPFADGRTSVGAVVSRAWIDEHRVGGGEPGALFARAVTASSTASRFLAGATMTWERPRAAADFSYRVGEIAGDGWLAVGDAAGFVDPLFSSGAHLAIAGAMAAAEMLADTGASPASEALGAWVAATRAATETFVLAVRAFYEGSLVDYLFADNKHTALRRSITSLLAGDVFHDAIWLRDARRRLGEMVGEA